MASWEIALIVLGIIALVLLILLLLYMLIAYRKIGIVAKKTDYLVEDVTYKSEMLMPTVESLRKLSKYIDQVDNYLTEHSIAIYDYLDKYTSNKHQSLASKQSKKTKSSK